MPAFGLGQFVAILTGIYAALDICGKGTYEELVKPLRKSYENSLILRRALERMDINKLISFVKAMDNAIASRLFSNRTDLDAFEIASTTLKPFFNEK